MRGLRVFLICAWAAIYGVDLVSIRDANGPNSISSAASPHFVFLEKKAC